MNQFNHYTNVLKKYVDFKGRASRAEFWWFILFNLVISMALSFGGGLISEEVGALLSGLYTLAVLLPSIGVSIRRLHDVGKSGWWLLINLIPFVGVIWYIVLVAGKGEGKNAWGAPQA